MAQHGPHVGVYELLLDLAPNAWTFRGGWGVFNDWYDASLHEQAELVNGINQMLENYGKTVDVENHMNLKQGDDRAFTDMLLDEEDVHLSTGDVVIQRGTNHAWVNPGPEPALMAFVLGGVFERHPALRYSIVEPLPHGIEVCVERLRKPGGGKRRP